MEFINGERPTPTNESKVVLLQNVEDLFDPHSMWINELDDDVTKDFEDFGVGGPA